MYSYSYSHKWPWVIGGFLLHALIEACMLTAQLIPWYMLNCRILSNTIEETTTWKTHTSPSAQCDFKCRTVICNQHIGCCAGLWTSHSVSDAWQWKHLWSSDLYILVLFLLWLCSPSNHLYAQRGKYVYLYSTCTAVPNRPRLMHATTLIDTLAEQSCWISRLAMLAG